MESITVMKTRHMGQSESMKEFRCSKCDKMLARQNELPISERPTVILCKRDNVEAALKIINSPIEIKCPRCKTLNEIMV